MLFRFMLIEKYNLMLVLKYYYIKKIFYNCNLFLKKVCPTFDESTLLV